MKKQHYSPSPPNDGPITSNCTSETKPGDDDGESITDIVHSPEELDQILNEEDGHEEEDEEEMRMEMTRMMKVLQMDNRQDATGA